MLRIKSTKKVFIKTIIAQSIMSMVGLPLFSNLAMAQTTTCTSSSVSCVDLYQGTISAIQAYGYQPATTISNAPLAISSSTTAPYGLNGGVLSGSAMNITVPSDQGTPVNTVLTSTYLYNCPGNTTNFTGTIEISSTISNSTTITSDSTVTNSNSTFNNGSATVGISVSEGNTATDGASGTESGSYTYSWGQTYETQTSTSSGTSVDDGTASTVSYTANYDLAPGYGQYGQITADVTSYTSDDWSSNITLTSPSTNPIVSQLYYQGYINVFNTPTYVSSINGSGVAANIWYAPGAWNAGTTLASPSGAYNTYVGYTGYLQVQDWDGTGLNGQGVIWNEGGWYGTSGQPMILELQSSCTGDCAGALWAVNDTYTTVEWDSNTSPSFIAMQDDGNFVGYTGTPSSATAIWSSGTNYGTSASPLPSYSTFITNPTTLLGSSAQAFVATGTYSATTYDSVAQMGLTTPAALTQDEIDTYCGGSSSSTSQGTSSINSPNKHRYLDGSDFAVKNPNIIHAALSDGQKGKFLLASDRSDQRRDLDQYGQDPRNRNQNLRNDGQGDSTMPRNGQSGSADRNDKLNSKKPIKPLGKLVKLNGDFELKKDQYYVADLPGLKVNKVVIRSQNHTNYNGFVGLETPKGSGWGRDGAQQIKLKLGNHRKFSVKPRKNTAS
jgi:hypothetical protein